VDKRNKNRFVLIAIVLIFAAPIVAALVLNVAGWRPATTRNSGSLVQPPADLKDVRVTLADGTKLDWSDPQWHWTLLVLSNGECNDACQTRLAELVRLRITLNRNAERLRIVYLGPSLPATAVGEAVPLLVGKDDSSALATYRPAGHGEVALALVDPNGLLMMRYADGYDAALLRADIVRVVH
jgi:hypothetical protein